MELVSASKMRRAVSSVLSTRPYARLALETIQGVASRVDRLSHPLLSERADAKKTLLIVIGSDRGFAGAFNTNLVKAVKKTLEGIPEDVDAVGIGRRATQALKKSRATLIASFENLTNKPTYKDIDPIGTLVIQEFSKGNYKRVMIAYVDFVSALTQHPVVFTLLPFGLPTAVILSDSEGSPKKQEAATSKESTFEPSPERVLDRVLPNLVRMTLYQSLLETAASEHSSRMMAMRNASDAAQEMLGDLTFTYNQIRQASITQEIAEISSGASALK
jgi:F-type H+-transporting ATPase subunit gamma